MRTVGYVAPLRAAVLNLTVIFEDHRVQRNLDPINKVTTCILQQSIYAFISLTYDHVLFV